MPLFRTIAGDGMRLAVIGVAVLLGASLAAPTGLAAHTGILLLAHGNHAMGGHGSAQGASEDDPHAAHTRRDQGPAPAAAAAELMTWNDNIDVIGHNLNKKVPTEIAFGMAETPAIQAAVDRLEKRGITRIAVIPLFISSHSPIIGNFRYILRLQENLGTRTSLKSLERITSKATFVWSYPMDADPLISEILFDRAKAVSGNLAKTNVVIVAHGPNDDEDNRLWLADMEKHAAYLKAKGFRAVDVLTHRNDAGPDVKSTARAAFRARVEAASRDGTTVVVPLLLAQGGIEKEVEEDLRGLEFVFGKPLAPHPNLGRWVEARFQAITAP